MPKWKSLRRGESLKIAVDLCAARCIIRSGSTMVLRKTSAGEFVRIASSVVSLPSASDRSLCVKRKFDRVLGTVLGSEYRSRLLAV